MRKFNKAFSLMEMMIIMLVVAIIAAATAPLVTRRLDSLSDGASENTSCLWNELENTAIYYNVSDGNPSVIIGGSDIPKNTIENADPKLYINSDNDEPEITILHEDTKTAFHIDAVPGKSTISLSDVLDNKNYENGVAYGYDAALKGDNAVSVGIEAKAGKDSVALGYQAEAATDGNESGAVAAGGGAKAGKNAVALGVEANAAEGAVAVGYKAQALGKNSIAVGNTAKATADNSIAIGSGVVANKEHQIVLFSDDKTTIIPGNLIVDGSTILGLNEDAYNFMRTQRYSHSRENFTDYSCWYINDDVKSCYKDSLSSFANAETAMLYFRGTMGGDPLETLSYRMYQYKRDQEGEDVSSLNPIATLTESSIEEFKNTHDEEDYKVLLQRAIMDAYLKAYTFRIDPYGNSELGYHYENVMEKYLYHTIFPLNTAVIVADIGESEEDKSWYSKYAHEAQEAVCEIYKATSVYDNSTNQNNHKEEDIKQFKKYLESQSERIVKNKEFANEILDEYRKLESFATSDKRLKNIGEKYTAGLEELKKLNLYHFTFKKDKDNTPHVGVMAQDLEKVFPNAVTKGEDGYLHIRLEEIFYALINSVKELNTIITDEFHKISDKIVGFVQRAEEQDSVIDELKISIESQQKVIEKMKISIAERQTLIEERQNRIEELTKKVEELSAK